MQKREFETGPLHDAIIIFQRIKSFSNIKNKINVLTPQCLFFLIYIIRIKIVGFAKHI